MSKKILSLVVTVSLMGASCLPLFSLSLFADDDGDFEKGWLEQFFQEVFRHWRSAETEQSVKALRQLETMDDERVLEKLIEALHDSDVAVRSAAAEILGKRKEERAYEALVEVAEGDRDRYVRIVAIEALKEIGNRSAGVVFLNIILSESFEGLRRAAISGFLSVKEQGVVDRAIAVAQNSQQLETRLNAIELLGYLDGEISVPVLSSLTTDRSWVIRAQVADSLGKAGDRRGFDPLVLLVRDGEERVRWKAVDALSALGLKEGAKEISPLLFDVSFQVRYSAVRALGLLGDESAVAPLLAIARNGRADCDLASLDLFEKLSSKELGALRIAATESLGFFSSHEAVEGLGSLLSHDFSPVVRQKAAASLGQSGNPLSIPYLQLGLRDFDRGVRLNSLNSIVGLSDPSELEPFLFGLFSSSDDPNLRKRAVEVLEGERLCAMVNAAWEKYLNRETSPGMLIPILRHYGGVDSFRRLVHFAGEGSLSDYLRVEAVKGLVPLFLNKDIILRIDDRSIGVKWLAKALRDEETFNDVVRNAILQVIQDLHKSAFLDGVPFWIAALEESDRDNRFIAVLLLGTYASSSTAYEKLEALLQSLPADEPLRWKVEEALASIQSRL